MRFLIYSAIITAAYPVRALRLKVYDCHSNDNISCKCITTRRHQISLANCTRSGGWSNWSNWSSCKQKHTQRRRRRCDNPVPIGTTTCKGEHTETRQCNQAKEESPELSSTVKKTIPEFVWGLWSEWNEWGECSCPANQRQRFRHCLGIECSGCGIEYGGCERRCVIERWWTNWSDWVDGSFQKDRRPVSVRYRSWCSLGADGRSLITTLVNESTTIASTNANWSKWEIRPGVAFRYRLSLNHTHISHWKYGTTPIDIQHQLIDQHSPTCVTLSFCLYVSIITMTTGFLAQCLISKIFASCHC